MAKISITIANEHIQRIISAFNTNNPAPAGLTPKQWTLRQLKEFIIQRVKRVEGDAAIKQAVADIDATPPTVDVEEETP